MSEVPTTSETLAESERLLANVLVLLRDGSFSGHLSNAVVESQNFIGNMFNEVKAQQETSNAETSSEEPAKPTRRRVSKSGSSSKGS